MTRTVGAVVLVSILAVESCPADQCSTGNCKAGTSTDSQVTIEPGAERQFQKLDCSSCGHAGVEATWTGLDGGDRVILEFGGQCADSTGLTPLLTTSSSGGFGKASITNVPSSDTCGQDAHVEWFATIKNHTNSPIINLTVVMSCPAVGFGNFSRLAGPSAVIKK